MPIKEIKKQYPGVNIGQVLAICPRYNLLYVVNPKSACSTVKLLLSRLESGDYEFDIVNIHKQGASLLPAPSDIGWKVVADSLTDPSEYYKFSFVRNPMARIISCYNDKIIKQANAFVPVLKKEAGYDDVESLALSFMEFLEIIETQELVDMDQHWRPQYYNLMLDCIDYDFIGKIENFDKDFEYVLESAGSPQISAVKKNKSNNKKNHLMLADTTLEERLLVQSIYKDDFQIFDYALEADSVEQTSKAA